MRNRRSSTRRSDCLAAAKRAADSAGTKVTPELKTQLAAVEKELADITREVGAANAGRGGGVAAVAAVVAQPVAADAADEVAVGARRRRVSAGAPPNPAGPAGGAGARALAPSDQEQNPAPPTTPQNIQAKLATTTEMLNATFNPNPAQKKTIQTLPAELQKQGDRVKKVSSDQLPALIKALKDAGIEVKSP